MTTSGQLSSQTRDFPAIVLGAGPAGLSVSAHLSRLGVPHAVLEQTAVGASWSTMPPSLHLVSPWWTNVLQWRDVFRHWPFAMVSARDYAQYLQIFSRRHQAPVVDNCRAIEVRPAANGRRFQIETSLGTFHTDTVVNATGYFSRPVGPEPPIQDDGSITTIHASRYPGALAIADLCGGRTALIVGRRISAGQLMVDLCNAGVPVALSTRSPIAFRRDGFVGAAKDFIYYFYEEALLSLKPKLNAHSFPVMDGGRSRQLVESGTVRLFARALKIQDGRICFEGGRELRPGVILLATGYTPCLPDLAQLPLQMDVDGYPVCEQWQTRGVRGLFFLGLDNRMNYRSRTIRGIRSDASKIAGLVKREIS